LFSLATIQTNLTFNDRMSLIKGDREIQIFYLSRGHTGGDIFVYLPKEKVLRAGDFLMPSLSIMRGILQEPSSVHMEFLDWIHQTLKGLG
jgi:glyoxylase-like metal-dependent hydrolase (beta-lactamase superfamily II)